MSDTPKESPQKKSEAQKKKEKDTMVNLWMDNIQSEDKDKKKD